MLRGDMGKARSLLENLLEIRQKNKNEIGWQIVRLNLCRVRLEQMEVDGVTAELEEIRAFFTVKIFITTKLQQRLFWHWRCFRPASAKKC